MKRKRTKSLPLPGRAIADKRPFNLYLSEAIARLGASNFKDRYGLSLSEGVDGLLAQENDSKAGILSNKYRPDLIRAQALIAAAAAATAATAA